MKNLSTFLIFFNRVGKVIWEILLRVRRVPWFIKKIFSKEVKEEEEMAWVSRKSIGKG
jgi:hypothetical protein